LLLYITNKVTAIAKALYPNMESNIVLYYLRGLNTYSQNYNHLTTIVSLGNNKIKYLIPTSKYKTKSCYLNYKKALNRLLGKLVIKYTDRLNILPSKNTDLIQLGS